MLTKINDEPILGRRLRRVLCITPVIDGNVLELRLENRRGTAVSVSGDGCQVAATPTSTRLFSPL